MMQYGLEYMYKMQCKVQYTYKIQSCQCHSSFNHPHLSKFNMENERNPLSLQQCAIGNTDTSSNACVSSGRLLSWKLHCWRQSLQYIVVTLPDDVMYSADSAIPAFLSDSRSYSERRMSQQDPRPEAATSLPQSDSQCF